MGENINRYRFKEKIEELNVSDSIRTFLHRAEEVASSDNRALKTSVPCLFLKSPSCKELSRIARLYEDIISSYAVYPFRGIGTYLELAFPGNNASDRDFAEFYASPGRVAYQNAFSGVFLLCLELYGGADELMNSPHYDPLVNYIETNKSHISFVFHVTPDFKNDRILYDDLSRYTNMEYLEHFMPDKTQAAAYIIKRIKEAGLLLSHTGEVQIGRLIDEKLDAASDSYLGYETLDRVSKKLLFELGSGQHRRVTAMGDTESASLNAEDILEASAGIVIAQDRDPGRRIGFN